jgi:hypothetical protein
MFVNLPAGILNGGIPPWIVMSSGVLTVCVIVAWLLASAIVIAMVAVGLWPRLARHQSPVRLTVIAGNRPSAQGLQPS